MEHLYLLLVVLLLAVALFDLVVGVSNDAVNFLTSAVGARAASLRTIMIVASVGVFVGAASSGGMMEIAKRGVFNPSLLSFRDVIFIYVVVMVTDIFVLDFFNSMRLPTSTTISIVFELLGASLAISFLRVYQLDQPVSEWMNYINTSKALEMIAAIFVSIGVAFAVGWVVQYITRGLMTFDYKRHVRFGGAVFGGLAVIVVLNFIVTVALKHSPLRDSSTIAFVFDHQYSVYSGAFGLAFAAFFILGSRPDHDSFRVTTLLGTFALAMAFASNDLVNFIGVPIAGFEAFGLWKGSGLAPDEYMMDAYAGPAGASTANRSFLLIAGAVMVVTLWKSRKARNVVQTTVDLSRQNQGHERFQGNPASRTVVRFAAFVAGAVGRLVPSAVRETIERRYAIRARQRAAAEEPAPAFDLVRASTNLTVAAALITAGTSLKLPLSTTYVTFMVLMGTSLADRAWSRDSAVYRVSGVFTVVAGWFFTAFTALALSAVFATIVGTNGFIGIGIVVSLVSLGLFTINRFTQSEFEVVAASAIPDDWFRKSPEQLSPFLRSKTAEIAEAYRRSLTELVEAVGREDRTRIRELQERMNARVQRHRDYRGRLAANIRQHVSRSSLETGKILLKFYVEETELLENVRIAERNTRLHVLNMHEPLEPQQAAQLREFASRIGEFAALLASPDATIPEAQRQLREVEALVDRAISGQIESQIGRPLSHKNAELFLTALVRHLEATRRLFRLFEIASGLDEDKQLQSVSSTVDASVG